MQSFSGKFSTMLFCLWEELWYDNQQYKSTPWVTKRWFFSNFYFSQGRNVTAFPWSGEFDHQHHHHDHFKFQIASYRKQGFILLPNLISPQLLREVILWWWWWWWVLVTMMIKYAGEGERGVRRAVPQAGIRRWQNGSQVWCEDSWKKVMWCFSQLICVIPTKKQMGRRLGRGGCWFSSLNP